ncbi:MAG: hypothetical protein H0V33_07480 [Acidimicrobiia bacterium]|nr:hypothetical protein [Acidimicrobiia bacterium]
MGLIARLAAGADAPVFVVVGAGGRDAARSLVVMEGVRVVDHPRAAALLVIVGRPTTALLRPMLLVHDQLPTPRATLWWPTGPGGEDLVAALGDVVVGRPCDRAGLLAVFTELVSGARSSDPPALADIEPAEWRGVGPYGQGGTGMTGGHPYGLPLAGRAPDPDGLELDQLPLQIGPLFPLLPPGLVLHLGVQGDVLNTVTVGENPYTPSPGDPGLGPLEVDVFHEAARAPVTVATLELARARHHLRWAAGALRLHGLHAKSRQLALLAESLTVDQQAAVARVVGRLVRQWGLRAAMSGVGVVSPADVAGQAGPVARASGSVTDARIGDPAYDGLGFEPVSHDTGDAWARFRQRLAEATQALGLAERAGDRVRRAGPTVEGPRGPVAVGTPAPGEALLALLPSLLAGQEWGDAMTTVVSLDLDLEEIAAATTVDAEP